MEAGPESCLYLSPQAGTGSSARMQEGCGVQPAHKWDILLQEPAYCMEAALLSPVTPYGWALLYPN